MIIEPQIISIPQNDRLFVPTNTLGKTGNRGFDNKNPGNMRIPRTPTGGLVDIPWKGKVPISQNTDSGKAFEQFTDFKWGIRAMAINLINGYFTKGLTTLQKILYRYAPPTDGNNTESYIATLEKRTGFKRNQTIIPTYGNMEKLCKAIVAVELGPAYADRISEFSWKEGLDMASSYFLVETAKKGGSILGLIAAMGVGYYLYTKYNNQQTIE